MTSHRFERNRRPVLYALAAALIAAATIAGLEAAGTKLTSAHSGLGGKLVPASDLAPANSPLR